MFYLFYGQNASTGKPNRLTGEMSFWGEVYSFKTKSARELAFQKLDRYNQRLLIKGGKQKMRQYCLGMSMKEFDEYLNYQAFNNGLEIIAEEA